MGLQFFLQMSGYYLFRFESYLYSSSGGDKDPKMCRREAGHVSEIFKAAKLRGYQFFSLGHLQVLDLIETRFVDAERRKIGGRSASTIKNFLLSLAHYVQFLFDKDICPDLLKTDDRDKFALRRKKWFTILNSLERKQTVKRTAKEIKELAHPKDVQDYFKDSKKQKTAAKLRGEHEEEWTKSFIPMKDIIEMRDNLMVAITSLNLLRPSGICNVTGEQLEVAEYHKQPNKYVVKVHAYLTCNMGHYFSTFRS